MLLRLIPLRLWLAVGGLALIGLLGSYVLRQAGTEAVHQHRAETAEEALNRAVTGRAETTLADALAQDQKAVLEAPVRSAGQAVREAAVVIRLEEEKDAPDPVAIRAARAAEHRLFVEAVAAANRALDGAQ